MYIIFLKAAHLTTDSLVRQLKRSEIEDFAETNRFVTAEHTPNFIIGQQVNKIYCWRTAVV